MANKMKFQNITKEDILKAIREERLFSEKELMLYFNLSYSQIKYLLSNRKYGISLKKEKEKIILEDLEIFDYDVQKVSEINKVNKVSIYIFMKKNGIVPKTRKIHQLNRRQFMYFCRKYNFSLKRIAKEEKVDKETVIKKLKELDLLDWFYKKRGFQKQEWKYNGEKKEKIIELCKKYGSNIDPKKVSGIVGCTPKYARIVLKKIKERDVLNVS
jgi:hypothetical protein